MTKLLLTLLVALALLTASCLGEGWMAGFAIGTVVLAPFLFLSSMLFARLIGLDQRIREWQER